MDLEQALAIVRANGFRATKIKQKKLARVGPTCVVRFADGEVYRMTTYCRDDNLDFARGVRLCVIARQSRHKHDCVPPVAHVAFERDGQIIGEQQWKS